MHDDLVSLSHPSPWPQRLFTAALLMLAWGALADHEPTLICGAVAAACLVARWWVRAATGAARDIAAVTGRDRWPR